MREHLSTTKVVDSLHLFYNYLNSNIASRETDGVRFSGYILDISQTKSLGRMGVGATSLGLSMYSLIVQGEDSHIPEMENLILSKRCSNGSWTISPLVQHNVSLVYTTCYALESLARSDPVRNQIYLEEGLNWLVATVNGDGGWGLTEQSASHIHPTAEVLYFASLFKGELVRQLFIMLKTG